jgi:hypothetical protein
MALSPEDSGGNASVRNTKSIAKFKPTTAFALMKSCQKIEGRMYLCLGELMASSESM